jgi:hypothetical protein
LALWFFRLATAPQDKTTQFSRLLGNSPRLADKAAAFWWQEKECAGFLNKLLQKKDCRSAVGRCVAILLTQDALGKMLRWNEEGC